MPLVTTTEDSNLPCVENTAGPAIHMSSSPTRGPTTVRSGITSGSVSS